jgi:hypothetical protein
MGQGSVQGRSLCVYKIETFFEAVKVIFGYSVSVTAGQLTGEVSGANWGQPRRAIGGLPFLWERNVGGHIWRSYEPSP